jgi:uncharacterized protein YggE
MKKLYFSFVVIITCGILTQAQEAGNRIYDRSQARSDKASNGIVTTTENKDLVPVQHIEAYVLLNAPADEFIAVFGVSQEGTDAQQSNAKANALIENFMAAAGRLGVKREDIYVDFITQNRIYNFIPESAGTIREKLTGFETKKTIAVRYKDPALLEKLLAAAAQNSIFDLIKVDYIIKDMAGIRARLLEQASQIIRQKEDNYNRLLNLKLKRTAVATERYETNYPGELYRSYTAFESGSVDNNYSSSSARVIRERKSSSAFLDPLDSSMFDAVINPLGVEPMVQCTLYLKLRYGLAP